MVFSCSNTPYSSNKNGDSFYGAFKCHCLHPFLHIRPLSLLIKCAYALSSCTTATVFNTAMLQCPMFKKHMPCDHLYARLEGRTTSSKDFNNSSRLRKKKHLFNISLQRNIWFQGFVSMNLESRGPLNVHKESV